MRIGYVHRGGEVMASYRYRCAIPAEGLRKLGHEVCINTGEADIVVFSKPMADDVEVAQRVKDEGAKIVFDVVDDHLTHPILGPMYNKLIEIADVLVAPTQNMVERVYRVSGKTPVVVSDPYEEGLQTPHANGHNLLWFGHLQNMKDLIPWKPALNGIRICTGPKPVIKDKPHKNISSNGSPWNESFIEWSPQSQTDELSKANIVIVPTRNGSEYKTSNRLLNAVRAGCFVIASHHPSHEEFKKMLWVGHIKSGLDWAKAFEDELSDRVKEAQSYVEKYSPDAIAKRWEEVLQ